MSRRASNNNVSLFPFLAVLVCAMGALILLLLVTTRRIRSNQIAALEAETVLVEPAAESVPLEAVEAEPQTLPVPSAPVEEPTEEPSVFPVAGPALVTSMPPGVTDDSRNAKHVENDRQALRGYDALLNDRLNQWSTADQQLHAQYSRATTEHNKLTDSERQLAKQAGEVSQLAGHTDETERRLDGQLTALRRALAEKEGEPVNAVSKFRIVPFDGLSGTVRRPIMIECVGDRYRFLPEGIELTKTELEDFVSGFNPLLSGAAALNAHWAMKDSQTKTAGEPYLLLVVRPSGSLGFYAAKRMLRRLDVPIGYELLGEKQELDLPIADPEAVQICRLAVQRTLARRDQMNTLRPMAQSLMAQAQSDVESGRVDSMRAARSGSGSGAGTSDERVESFRRITAGMRTQNAPRPAGMDQFPNFRTPAPRRQRSNRSPGTGVVGNTPPGGNGSNSANAQTGRRGGQSVQPWANAGVAPQPGSAQLRGRPVSQSGSPDQGPSPQQPGLAQGGRPDQNDMARFPNLSGSRSQQNNLTGVMPEQPGAARMAPPRLPAPQPAAPSNTPPGSTMTRRSANGTPRPYGISGHSSAQGRPTSITDGSTKPLDRTAPGQGSGAQPGQQHNWNAQTPPPGLANLSPGQQGQQNQQASPQSPQVTLFRRAVDLFVDPNSVIVANNKRIGVGQEEVSGPWLGAVLTQIEAEVRAWGEAPMGSTWAPEVRFRISPGANRTHTRLRSALKRLGMRTTDEFTITPHDVSARDVFQSSKAPQRRGGSR